MKDRDALGTKRPITLGLTPQQAYDSVAEKKGIPMHQVREGVIPAQKGLGPRGIQFDSPGLPRVVAPVCKVPTKSGEPCKARPIHGQPFCIGHGRQVRKND